LTRYSPPKASRRGQEHDDQFERQPRRETEPEWCVYFAHVSLGFRTDGSILPARGKDPLAKLLDGLDSADYDQNIKDVVKQSQSLLHDLRNAVQAGMATWDSWLSKIQAISSAGR
jgi:hypothetical protein